MLVFFFGMLLGVLVGGEVKITDGRTATSGEFPFAVAIRGPANCGGSLITVVKILTAAHCLFVSKTTKMIDVTKFYVIGGTADISRSNIYDQGMQKRDILNVVAHQEYRWKNDGTKTNDVGLVIVTNPFILSDTCSLATFPATNEKDFLKAWDDLVASGKTCVAIGWGRVTRRVKPGEPTRSSILKVAVLVPVPRSQCSTFYWKNDTDMSEKEVCAVGMTDTEGVCYGDSGGALVCLGDVYGIVKSGPCGNNTKEPSFFSLVGPYLSFFGTSSRLAVNHWFIFCMQLLVSGAKACASRLES